jgi:hypothetical protein
MRAILLVISASVAFGLAGCGSSTSTIYVTRTPAAVASSAAPVATASTNPDAHPCWAFHQATTKGVPTRAAGEDTMTWLQSQIASADPALLPALQRFITGWQMADPGKIARAARAVKALCAAA